MIRLLYSVNMLRKLVVSNYSFDFFFLSLPTITFLYLQFIYLIMLLCSIITICSCVQSRYNNKWIRKDFSHLGTIPKVCSVRLLDHPQSVSVITCLSIILQLGANLNVARPVANVVTSATSQSMVLKI